MLTIDNAGYVTYPVFRGELDVQLLNQLFCLLLLEVHDGVKDLEGGRGREEGGRGRKGNNCRIQLSFKVSVTIPV